MESSEVSEAQYLLLLEFMERHGDISRPQLRSQSQPGAEQLWQDLVDSLNAAGPANNTCDQWKKVWADWKCQTLERAMKILCTNIGMDCGSRDMAAVMTMAARQLANNGDPRDLSATRQAIPSTSTETVTQAVSQPSTSRPTAPRPRVRPRRPFAAARRSLPTARAPPPLNMTTLTSVMRRHGALPPRAPAHRRHAAMSRVAMLFADLEKSRIRLEQMKLRKEARCLDLQQRMNGLLGRLVDVAEGMFQVFLQKNRPQ